MKGQPEGMPLWSATGGFSRCVAMARLLSAIACDITHQVDQLSVWVLR
ncbi:hypothetical protein [Synechococcus sp. MIT S9503]